MKKLSTQEKRNRGTLMSCREKKGITYEAISKIPEPTTGLDIVGLQYFNHVCQSMITAGTLLKTFIPAICRASDLYSIFQQAKNDIQEHGAYQVTDKGYSTTSGYFQVMINSEKQLSAFEKSFGLDLVSHQKLPPSEPSEGLYFTAQDHAENPMVKIGAPKPKGYNPFDYV